MPPVHTALQRRQSVCKITRAAKLPMSSEGFIFRKGEQQLKNIAMVFEFPLYIGEMVDAVDTGGTPSLAL